ncbi:unknown protein [Cronobacter turicensis z3032]|uniref:Integrase n=1 Tax=Cronobacter turicensis (strain DSM 18703 / CCUG 55852 / LMG 23827 / z3032) TaxID=693216 RepID=C9Y3T7_CROTZ|nr:unknown protein [Cronobacter turicensis z3032]
MSPFKCLYTSLKSYVTALQCCRCLLKISTRLQASADVNPNFIANQMGHTNAQMVFNFYAKWISIKNIDPIAILNLNAE